VFMRQPRVAEPVIFSRRAISTARQDRGRSIGPEVRSSVPVSGRLAINPAILNGALTRRSESLGV
jgi:hypothetical protein